MKKQEIVSTFYRIHGEKYQIYPNSIKDKNGLFFFMVRGIGIRSKLLGVIGSLVKLKELKFETNEEKLINCGKNLVLQLCPLTHYNLVQLQTMFDYLKPSGSNNFPFPSFGTGDRLGIATPAHIQAFKGENIFPVLAQLSTREITRTESSLQRVLDNAIWGCFEMGYEGPFGADADHIKDFDNLQKAINCGFRLFTLDPSDHIDQEISKYKKEELRKKYQQLPERYEIEKRYLEQKYQIGNHTFVFDQDNLAEIVLIYGDAIKHIVSCYQFLKEKNKEGFELEVSIDETQKPTSPLAHLWIALELHRKDVNFQNLAPHYIGNWEKGINYIGDVNKFQEEFKLHCQIAFKIGGYKLSLHSGSDKFSVYPIFARESGNIFHIKTAGTSWLEAVKVIATCEPDLYREIHQFALSCFEKDRFSYHLSTNLKKIPDLKRLSDEELLTLFSNDHARQLIHITYGSILREKNREEQYRFRDRIYQTLFDNEENHYQAVTQHIKHHLELLRY